MLREIVETSPWLDFGLLVCVLCVGRHRPLDSDCGRGRWC